MHFFSPLLFSRCWLFYSNRILLLYLIIWLIIDSSIIIYVDIKPKNYQYVWWNRHNSINYVKTTTTDFFFFFHFCSIQTCSSCICVIIPAVIAISICAILFFANRKKDRKLNRHANRSFPYVYQTSREQIPQDTYIIDFTRAYRSQQQRRREPPPVIEQAPPAYETTIVQTRRQPLSLYTPVRTLPTTNNKSTTTIVRPSSHVASSARTVMPPSYAEIFLSPETLPNG